MSLQLKKKTDWTKCCLCQEDSKESLKSPPSSYNPKSDGYRNIATNVPLFLAINAAPMILDPARLDEGDGIEATLKQNNAKYHQSCRLLFSNSKLERARKRLSSDEILPEPSCSKIPRTQHSPKQFECFLCQKESKLSELRSAMTMQLNERLNECARNLNDGRLLALLSGGDAVALELKYHPSCLAGLYNRERAYLRSLETESSEYSLSTSDAYPQAFSELVLYIVETKTSCDVSNAAIFKLVDLVNLYKQRLEQLGIESPEVNSTRLKEKLIMQIPELEAYTKGRDVMLAFNSDVGTVLSQASGYSDAIILAKAAKILRGNMLDHKSKFNGQFHDQCVEESIPSALLQFISMIEHGADIKSQLRFGSSKADLAIAQILQYNCYARYKEGMKTNRRSKERETPFPVYIGLSLFAKTRKRHLVELLHENGISISYDRVLEISAQLGEAVINQYTEEGVVCPPRLRKGLFTTAAMDNIDHNPTATTASTSFHGTSISIFQHPATDNRGDAREPVQFQNKKVKSVPELPDSFTNIKPAHFTMKHPKPTAVKILDISTHGPHLFNPVFKSDFEWLEKVAVTEEIDNAVSVSWSAHHASQLRGKGFEVSTATLLPLLRDQSHSVATIKHVMDKVNDVVELLNPGQIPVITADQPIYSLAKQVQWHWPDLYGESKFQLILGGLHIEMAALRSVGTLLQDSGWVAALSESEITTPGTAESFLTASSVTRCRQAHQITACSLFQLMKTAYADYCNDSVEETLLDFEDWCEMRKRESPQFLYWNLILSMELAIFALVRSFREANFTLYCESLSELIPYFFANNNVNYARWLPVHLRDMMSLEERHPKLAENFQNGNFVVHKSDRNFSAMAIDQAHEQANAVIKGDGGAVGITEDASALRRWMVAGPEICHLIAQYESVSNANDATKTTSHHEQSMQKQGVFFERVNKLTTTIQEMGNPFQEESGDLMTLDTKDVADGSAAEMIGKHFEKGNDQFLKFMKCLDSGDDRVFYQPIHKNKMNYFKQESTSSDPKHVALKEDYRLFSQLFISCQSRQCDLRDFFKHENHPTPASLSDNGKIHASQKSQLTDILESLVQTSDMEPQADVIVIDGSALVNSLVPRSIKTFDNYCKEDFIPTVEAYSAKYKRTDIVFDTYVESSLKSETREKRGRGSRRKVSSNNKTPKNWQAFMRNSNNKNELFHFLAEKVTEVVSANTVIATFGQNVKSNKDVNTQNLAPCTQEEADTRIFVHARDAALDGYKSVVIKANDTDVLVIAIAVLSSLEPLGMKKMWILFGQGCHVRSISVHDIASAIGPDKASGILFFHAFTGCDVVSAFRGKGKKSAWLTWNVCPATSATFSGLSQYPPVLSDSKIQALEKFVVTMYDRGSEHSNVNEARMDLFARKQRLYESIPPTKSALEQHTRRAAYQAGYIWRQATVCQPDIPSPENWGWIKQNGRWAIKWTTLPPIASCCQELTKCGCKTICHGRCKCYRLGLLCTALCSCSCDE